MSRDLNDINASSRGEMVCPECWERGLVAHQRRVQAYDSDKDKIIHASGCRTEGCKHHYKKGEPIPAKVIEMQLGAGRSFNPKEIVARTSLKTVGVILGISLFGVALLIAVTGLPFLSGPGGGGGVASADTNVSKADNSISEVGGGPNWTVYKYGDQYVVAGENSNGETVYLNGNGEVVDSVHFFDTEQNAIDAIEQWEQIAVENPESTIDPDARNISSPELESPWSVFKVNSSAYVVAAENSEGNVVFLNPDGTVTVEPHFYDTQKSAEEALIEWNLDNLPSSDYSETTASEVENVLNDGTTAPISGGGGGGGGGGTESDSLDGSESTGQYNVTEVKGSVSGPSGDALTNAKVILDGGEHETTTNQSGEYYFGSVENGTHTLSIVPTNLESTAAPRSAILEVGDNGDIELQEAPSSAIYFTDSDGDVARNEIDWAAPEAQQIRALGNGSNIGSNITFANSLNANNVTVELSTVTTSSKRTITLNGSGSRTIETRGNTRPEDARLTLTGDSNSESVSKSGSTTGETFRIDGNLNPNDVSASLSGNTKEQQHEKTVTVDDGQVNLNVGGNVKAKDVEIAVTGTERDSVIKSGNVKACGGHDPYLGDDTSGCDSEGGTEDRQETIIPSPPDGTSRSYTVKLDYYLDGGYDDSVSLSINQEVSPYQVWVEPVMGGDPYKETRTSEKIWGDCAGVHYSTSDSCEPDPNDAYKEFSFSIDKPSNPQNDDHGAVNLSGYVPRHEYSDGLEAEGDYTTIQHQKTREVQISGAGNWDAGFISPGETKRTNLGTLSPGQHTFNVDTSGAAPAKVKVTWTEVTATKNVKLSSGSQTLCEQQVLKGSKDCSINSDLVDPRNDFSVSSDSVPVDYTLDYTARSAVDDMTVSLDDQTFNYPEDFGASGLLKDGENASVDIGSLDLGGHAISMSDVQSNGLPLSPSATLEYTGEITTSYKPTVHVVQPNGTTKTYEIPDSQLDNNRLTENQTVKIPQSYFGDGENRVYVRTADGSFVRADLHATGLQYQANRFTREGEAG